MPNFRVRLRSFKSRGQLCRPPLSPARNPDSDDKEQGQHEPQAHSSISAPQFTSAPTQQASKSTTPSEKGESSKHKSVPEAALSMAEQEVSRLQQVKEIMHSDHWKEAVEWERRILHSVNATMLRPTQVNDIWYASVKKLTIKHVNQNGERRG